MILDDSSYKMLYHVLVYYEKKYKKKKNGIARWSKIDISYFTAINILLVFLNSWISSNSPRKKENCSFCRQTQACVIDIQVIFQSIYESKSACVHSDN